MWKKLGDLVMRIYLYFAYRPNDPDSSNRKD